MPSSPPKKLDKSVKAGVSVGLWRGHTTRHEPKCPCPLEYSRVLVQDEYITTTLHDSVSCTQTRESSTDDDNLSRHCL